VGPILWVDMRSLRATPDIPGRPDESQSGTSDGAGTCAYGGRLTKVWRSCEDFFTVKGAFFGGRRRR